MKLSLEHPQRTPGFRESSDFATEMITRVQVVVFLIELIDKEAFFDTTISSSNLSC